MPPREIRACITRSALWINLRGYLLGFTKLEGVDFWKKAFSSPKIVNGLFDGFCLWTGRTVASLAWSSSFFKCQSPCNMSCTNVGYLCVFYKDETLMNFYEIKFWKKKTLKVFIGFSVNIKEHFGLCLKFIILELCSVCCIYTTRVSKDEFLNSVTVALLCVFSLLHFRAFCSHPPQERSRGEIFSVIV